MKGVRKWAVILPHEDALDELREAVVSKRWLVEQGTYGEGPEDHAQWLADLDQLMQAIDDAKAVG